MANGSAAAAGRVRPTWHCRGPRTLTKPDYAINQSELSADGHRALPDNATATAAAGWYCGGVKRSYTDVEMLSLSVHPSVHLSLCVYHLLSVVSASGRIHLTLGHEFHSLVARRSHFTIHSLLVSQLVPPPPSHANRPLSLPACPSFCSSNSCT